MRFNIGELDVIEERAKRMSKDAAESPSIQDAATDLLIASLRLGIALRQEYVEKCKKELK